MLCLVSTPIGNLEDLSFRALRILKEADRIAAEDTRHSRKLLDHYGVRNTLESYHDHNKESRTPALVRRMKEGQTIALISDAGTPGISDPAFYLVREAVRNGIPVVPVPGPAAAIAALTVSGLPTDRFAFEGFLPAKKGRKTRLLELSEEPRTLILYESPHRLLRTLGDLHQVLGERHVALCRELTKKFEEIIRGSLSDVLEKAMSVQPRGEYVIIVEGSGKKHEKPD